MNSIFDCVYPSLVIRLYTFDTPWSRCSRYSVMFPCRYSGLFPCRYSVSFSWRYSVLFSRQYSVLFYVGTPCCSCDGTPCRVFVSFITFNCTVDLYWKFRGYAVGFKSYTLFGQCYTSDEQCCYTVTINAFSSVMMIAAPITINLCYSCDDQYFTIKFYAATIPTNYVVLLNDNLCLPYRPTL